MARCISLSRAELGRFRRMGRPAAAGLLALLALTGLLVWLSFRLVQSEHLYSVYSDDPKLASILEKHPKIRLTADDSDVAFCCGRASLTGTDKSLAAMKAAVESIQADNQLSMEHALRRGELEYYDLFPVWVRLLDINGLGDGTGEARPDEELELARQQYLSRDPASVRAAVEGALTKTQLNELTTPGDLNKVLPLKSLMLAIFILTPLIFISTGHNNSFFDEKVDKRATLLFVSPASRWALVFGKSLPYLAGSLLVIVPALAFFGRSAQAVLLALPPLIAVVVFYYSLNFMLTVLSRSYKEMSFLKTSIGSAFIAYLLLPTLFMDISDIAFISPLTSIAHLAEHGSIAFKPYVFSFLPMLLAGFVIYMFAGLLFNEEHYYSHRPLREKLLVMIALFLKSPWRIAALTALTFPLVLVAEVMFLMLVALPTRDIAVLFLLLIAVAAVVEEFFKNIGIYLVYKLRLFRAGPLLMAALSGLTFALIEKAALLAMLPSLVSAYGRIVLPALAVPFLFHALTCYVFALLIRRTPDWRLFVVPMAMHLIYGLAVFGVFA